MCICAVIDNLLLEQRLDGVIALASTLTQKKTSSHRYHLQVSTFVHEIKKTLSKLIKLISRIIHGMHPLPAGGIKITALTVRAQLNRM